MSGVEHLPDTIHREESAAGRSIDIEEVEIDDELDDDVDDELDDDLDDDDDDELEFDNPDDPDDSQAIELVVLDMAGTTVQDDGLVLQAFELAVTRTGVLGRSELPAAQRYVIDTMGQSKIDVFRALVDSETDAQAANAEFERAYLELTAEIGAEEIDGAEDVIRELRDAGATVVLTTGFAPATRDAILRSLGWSDLADLALSPIDAGRGRPAPDMVLAAMIHAEVTGVANVAVVGDTRSDMESGERAGVGLIVGVLTGAHNQEDLLDAGAHTVIGSITELPALLGLRE